MKKKTIRTWKVFLCVLCVVAALLPVIGGFLNHDLTRKMMLPDAQREYSRYYADEYETLDDYLNSVRCSVAVFDSRNVMTLIVYLSVVVCVLIVAISKKSVISIVVSIVAGCVTFFIPNLRFILPEYRWCNSFFYWYIGTWWVLCAVYIINAILQIARMRADSAPERKAKREAYYHSHSPAPKSKTVAIILAIFCGGMGGHRYYLGYTKQAIIQSIGFVCTIVGTAVQINYYWDAVTLIIAAMLLLIGGCTGIWAFVDFIRILTGALLPADGSGYKDKTMNPLASSASDTANALETLAKLHEQGILTDEEFQQKKADLLAKM